MRSAFRPTFDPARLVAAWSPMLVGISFLAIAFFTLFPFNFTVPHGMTLRQAAAPFDWRIYDPSNLADSWENVILFVPFGFAVACLARPKSSRAIWGVLLALVASTVFSGSIEFLQQWLPFRESTFADICTNSLGGLAGAVLFQGMGETVLSGLTRLLTDILPKTPLIALAILFALLLGVMLRGPIRLRHAHRDLSNWDPTYTLAIGNDPRGDRAWEGSVQRLDFASTAIPPEKVSDAFAADDLRSVLSSDVQAEYRIVPSGTISDLTNQSPALEWVNVGPPPSPPTIQTSQNRWLASVGPMSKFSSQVANSSAFTIRCQFQSALASQNPELGRIFAIAIHSLAGNIVLGQQKTDLVLRVRGLLMGGNGTNPATVIPEFFVDPAPHTLIITYDDPVLRLYVDRRENEYSTEHPVDFGSISSFLARPMTLPFNGYLPEMYRAVFFLLNFGTLALFIPILAVHHRLTAVQRKWTILTAAAIPTILLQFVLIAICHRSLRADNLILGVMITGIVGFFATIWLIRLKQAANAPQNLARSRLGHR